MSNSSYRIGAIIPTLNVANTIRPTLDSLMFADEVIIVDMFSTDATEEVCRSYPNVRFFQKLDYIYGNFNFGIDQSTSEWLLKIDSDEVLTQELQSEILNIIKNPEAGIDGYEFNSIQYMFGQPMHYGVGHPSLTRRLSMFRRGTARYQVRSEHEGLDFLGRAGLLNGAYHHHTNHTTGEVIRKFDYYTEKDIERIPLESLKPPSVLHVAYRCIRQFFWMYFQMRGYKDGRLGFFSSVFRGPVYILIEEAKRWERWQSLHTGSCNRAVSR